MYEIDNNSLVIQNSCDEQVADLKSKTKIEKEWPKIPHQKYSGEVFLDNLHGQGFYFVEDGAKLFYDGLFYSNKLEGYAQVFYNDGSNFQGLFKNNVRFGPGIFTYPNGEQDVGLWRGQRLLRLASLDTKNFIQRLATTPSGQLKLLKYRYLVPVYPKHVDTAYNILQELGANENILQKSQELYNLDVRNKHSLFFNKKLFNEQFYGDQDFSIEVDLTEEELAISDSRMEVRDPVDSNIDQERVIQINKVLELIESKLKAAQKIKVGLHRRVEYCRACCRREQEQEESTAQPRGEDETDSNEVSLETETSTSSESTTRTSSRSLSLEQSESSDSSITIKDIDTVTIFSEDRTSCAKSPSVHSISVTSSDVLGYPDTDVVIKIENYLMDTCRCGETVYLEDLYELEKELEAVTRDELFFESITNNLKVKLEKHQKQTRNERRVKTKKVFVDYILAWNNEKYCTRMLKHSFIHRKSEYMVNFKISDLVAGNRSKFGSPGERERNSIDFLAACSKGDKKSIYEHIEKNSIDANVCDSKGNNGVFFAAKHNHAEIIRILVNSGAKIDKQNDEGLLPLSMCLLRILAKKHNVENWEKSFLPEADPSEELEQPYKWYSNISLLNMSSKRPTIKSSPVKSKSQVKASPKIAENTKTYLFDTSFVIMKKTTLPSNNAIQRKMSFGPTVASGPKSVEHTITTLLQLGANPNSGSVPLPIVFLSLFTENPHIVENILEAHADVQITLENGQTCLHVIASSKCTRANVCICHLLISYHCDARTKTSPSHWDRQKLKILGKRVAPNAVEDYGKNPLHILCVREDFVLDYCSYFQDMVMNFKDSNVNFNERYLGHTPLSLAVLVGNKKLVEVFIEEHLIDPHQVLDYNMGNVLTIYILKRYEDSIPPNAREILDCMVSLSVNILNPVGEFDNSIEFMEEEHAGQLGKRDTPQETIMDYIMELGRDTITRCIQLLVVENLYNLIENDYAQHRCVPILTQYLTPPLVISNLQLLFNHGIIKPERFDRNVSLQLINIVKTSLMARNEPKRKYGQAKTNQDAGNIAIDATDYGYILNMMNFTRLEKETKFKLLPPGLDDISSKYKVCFHCLQKRNRYLVVCPKCQLIFFCSKSCNKENVKLNLHPCNNIFYQSELDRLDPKRGFSELENLAELFSRVREDCEKRRLEKLQVNLELERKRLKEEMKSDTYGTKMLRKMKLTALHMTPTLNSLLGSPRSFNTSADIRDLNVGDVHSKETRSSSIRRHKSADKKLGSLLSRVNRQTTCKKELNCRCKECIDGAKESSKIKCICPSNSKKTRPKIEVEKGVKDTTVTVHKLRVIPKRCQEFLKLLKENCPELDFSSLLLPYACYSNGHLYYRFLGDNHGRTYSMM